MGFSITTWNINSVRLRMPIVEQLVLQARPDILCLQETKVTNDLFPSHRSGRWATITSSSMARRVITAWRSPRACR